MRLKKRGKTYHIDTVVNGQRIRQSLETTDWRKAQAEAKKLVAQAEAGKLHTASIAGRRQPFDAAADAYMALRTIMVSRKTGKRLSPSSLAQEGYLLVSMRTHFQQAPLRDISAERINAYLAKREDAGIQAATINAEIAILKRILKRAKLWARIDDGEIVRRALPETIGRALSEAEIQRLLQVAQSKPEWENAFLGAVISLSSTKRGGDFRSLQWKDVDLFAATISIPKAKTKASESIIPLTASARSAFARLRSRAQMFGPVEPEHYVFASFRPQFKFDSTQVVGYALAGFDPTRPVKSWRSAWRSLTKKAGLPGLRFHDLRHTSITILAESGAADGTIRSIAGHVSGKMLDKYSHIRMEAKRKALAALDLEIRLDAPPADTIKETNILN